MAEKKEIKDLRDINLSKINPTGYVDSGRLDSILKQMADMKRIIDELLDIRDKSINIPSNLIGKVNAIENTIRSYIEKIEKKETGEPANIANLKEGYLREFHKFYSECFNLDSPNNPNNLLKYYAIIKSFSQDDNAIQDQFEDIKSELKGKYLEASDLVNEMSGLKNDTKSIFDELAKKASSQNVSDYAKIFELEAKKYLDQSKNWIITGIALSVVFVVVIILIALTEFLPTEIINEATKQIQGYNITNILTKLLIIAIIVYLISFSFKQFSVNRHLHTLNKHRQNALNSYQLFVKTIGADDVNSRNVLMIQVAKSIYEHSQSTGYLSEKRQNVNSGIVELTKIIGQNSTT